MKLKHAKASATSLLFSALFSACAIPSVASAQTAPAPTATPSPAPQLFNVHLQATNLQMYHPAFPAAYSGPQSITNLADTAKTFDFTLYLGARVWKGGELYLNPEIDQGFGLGYRGLPGQDYLGTVGAGGYVSGEAYKVGAWKPYQRVQRAFLRQTFDLGGTEQYVAPDINQLGGTVTARHVTVTLGKFSVPDVFDTNPYAHDPRNDFANWALIDMGAFDYAADSWGYTCGVSGEYVTPGGAARVGLFQLSKEPNQIAIEHVPFLQYSPIVEVERDTSFFGGHPGQYKALVYGDYGYFGSYADALALGQTTGTVPNTAAVRTQRRWKIGSGINIAQEVADHVGVFLRASAMNGTYEADEFTEIDRSISGGVSIDGGLYRRPNDQIGIGYVTNGLSVPAQQYFAAGGIGVLLGDGGLSYAAEQILETYYKVGLTQHGALTLDYQRLNNPGYNTARGPLSVYGLRYHLNF